MRIGILGGTFDPIHNGHTALARAAMSELGLDRILFIPSGEPPYKKPHAGSHHRFTMARLAAETVEGAEVCDIEIMRSGPTYAADTLAQLKQIYPDSELIYVLGSDAAAKVDKWVRADEAKALCKFACVVRAGAAGNVPDGMLKIEADIPMISSESIRRLLCEGEDASAELPRSVAEYIDINGLYISEMPEHEVYADLKANLKPSRFQHTLGVAATCAELAKKYGAPQGRAYVAGMVHDCAKYMTEAQLMELAEVSGADEDEIACIPVLHAPVGAYIARTRYGIRDEEVLSAIRRHTVGAADMSLMDAILYVADMIEPGRKYFDGLEKARQLAHEDIFKAAALCGRLTRQYNQKRGSALHPMTEIMINNIENGGMNNG